MILIGGLIYIRLPIITGPQPQSFDLALLAVAAALVLIPFFSELSVFGVSLKQKPDEVRSEKNNLKETATTNQTVAKPETISNESVIEAVQSELKPTESELIEPKPWFIEASNALVEKNSDAAEAIFKKAQSLETNGVERLTNEGFYYYLRYISGDTNALRSLIKLIESSTQKDGFVDISRYLGLAYEHSNNYDLAVDSYNKALEKAVEDNDKAVLITAIARNFYKLDKVTKAFEICFEALADVKQPASRAHIYEALGDLYEQANQMELRALALEKALSYKPENKEMRFSAAYSYSVDRLSALSLMHYNTLFKMQPDNTYALNNMGVQYTELKMPIFGVSYYKRSDGKGETLAGANLAYKLMEAGFAEEAQSILDRARRQDDVHPNIGSALASLGQRKEAESLREKTILTTARQQQQFILRFADSVFCKSSSVSLHGNWMIKDGTPVVISHSQESLSAIWETSTLKHKIEGMITGHAIRLTYSKSGVSAYSYFSEVGKGYGIVSSDTQFVDVLIFNNESNVDIQLQRTVNSLA